MFAYSSRNAYRSISFLSPADGYQAIGAIHAGGVGDSVVRRTPPAQDEVG